MFSFGKRGSGHPHGQRLRRWLNIELTLDERHLFASELRVFVSDMSSMFMLWQLGDLPIPPSTL